MLSFFEELENCWDTSSVFRGFVVLLLFILGSFGSACFVFGGFFGIALGVMGVCIIIFAITLGIYIMCN